MGILKRKPKPPSVPGLAERTRNAVNSHPKISIATVGTVIAMVGVVAPWMVALEDRYQRKLDAAAEMAAHVTAENRKLAWTQAGQAKTEALVLRNRLNDCAVQVAAGKKQSPLELSICKQYDDEYHDADVRAKEARLEAMKATK